MTPFQEFRLWARRAPVGERVGAAVAAVIALSLLVWLVAPTGGQSSRLQTGADRAATDQGSGPDGATAGAADTGDGATATSSTTAVTSATNSTVAGAGRGTSTASTTAGAKTATTVGRSGAAGTGTGTQTAAGSGACASPPGSDQGVSDNQIKIAITLVNIVGPAGNSTFGVPSVDEQRADFEQVTEAINKAGGVACRELVLNFYTVNPADQSDQQQKCLAIVQAKPFFVIDAGGYYGSASANCYPQNQLPFMGTGRVTNSQRDKFYPYLFAQGSYEVVYKNALFALRDRGFFTAGNGFKKLGYIHRSCWPEITTAFLGWLHDVGIADAQIVSYDVGCPSGNFANPSDLQQAILKFQTEGVTHLTESFFFQDFANFTKIAQAQGFKPKYGLADDSIVPTSQGSLHPDYDNVADAIAIAGDRYGEEKSDLPPSAGTAKCNEIFKAKARPQVYEQPVGFGGVACSQLWMMESAIEHAPKLERASLADGLRAAKTVELSYPRGPVDFSAPKVTYGGQFWRPLQFFKDCPCWKVIDAKYQVSF